MIPMLNVHNRPELVALSTRQGTQSNSSLSDVTWSMRDILMTQSQNHAGVITLHSMMFYNTFANININNNTLKILSTYTVEGVETSDIMTVTVPPGHYDVAQLVDYLNGATICSRLDTYVYGMGSPAVPQVYKAFEVSTSDPSKIWLAPPAAGTGTDLGAPDSAHIYKGFHLIVDSTTTPFLQLFGLIERNQSHGITNVSNYTFAGATYRVIGFKPIEQGGFYVYNTSDDETGVVTARYVATNCINMGGPTCLTVSLENVYANSRNSYDNLAKGNTIAVIPLEAAYGYKNTYRMAPNEFGCVVPNLNMTQIRLTVRDGETGERVDFQGNEWVATLKIEYYEIETQEQSSSSKSGQGHTSHTTNHTQVLDHNLPFSGKRKIPRYTHEHAT